MPFVLKNALASFQRAAKTILTRAKWEFALVFPDDTTVFSKSITEPLGHVPIVAELLRKPEVTLKFSKHSFFYNTASFLGQTIRPGKLAVDNKNRKAVRKFLPPMN